MAIWAAALAIAAFVVCLNWLAIYITASIWNQLGREREGGRQASNHLHSAPNYTNHQWSPTRRWIRIVATATAATAATTAASAVAISTRQHCEGNLIEIAFAKRLGDELLLSINKINLKQLFFYCLFPFLPRSLDSCWCCRHFKTDVQLFVCVRGCVCGCVRLCVCIISIVFMLMKQKCNFHGKRKRNTSVSPTHNCMLGTHTRHTHQHTLSHLLCWQIKLSLHFIIAF